MRNTTNKFIILCAIFLFFTILQCTPDYEKKINAGNELYKQGNISEALANVENGIIDSVSKTIFQNRNFYCGRNSIYYFGMNNILFIYPTEFNINIKNDYNIIHYDHFSKIVGLSNGNSIKLYHIDGNLLDAIEPVKEDKHKIKTLLTQKNNIYYFINKRIYVYNYNSQKEKQVIKERFFKPFKGSTFNVNFHLAGKTLALSVGIGGKYNFSIINLQKNSMVIKNLRIASSKLLLTREYVYYITGKSGKWSLIKMSIHSKKKKTLIKFSNLYDVEFFNSGFIFEDKKGLWIYNFEKGNKLNIPFNYKLAGACDKNPIIKFSNNYHLTDMTKFMHKFMYFRKIMPGLFKE